MSDNLLRHEDEQMTMAQKLALMKNQIMEYDRYIGIDRKYGSVRIQTLKNYPVTVSKHSLKSAIFGIISAIFFILCLFLFRFLILIFWLFYSSNLLKISHVASETKTSSGSS